MEVGAGTVTSVELAELAHSAGAKFIISPDSNPAVIRRTKELGMVSLPGALTPSEAMIAHNAGADFVKLFPISDLGVGYVKAVRAPLSHIDFMAVGGVNTDNLKSFLDAGCVGAGIGGCLVNKKWVEAGEFDKITQVAEEMVKIIQEYNK
jgi:2-dehydro-3-deoxyphosphogluconate aldolase/(4S)-4-hydroxy-2-oxoglutarate aldolase